MRGFLAPTTIALGLTGACGNERQPMDATTPRAGQVFLGPIAEDFRNTLSTADFRAAAGVEAARIDAALATLGFGQAGVALTGAHNAEPDLPSLDQCDHLRDFTGGFLAAGDVATATAEVDLLELDGLACTQIAAALDASFSGLAVSSGVKTRNMASFSLSRDRCTAAVETPPTTIRAALGYEFLRLVGGDGLYLNSFNLGEFQSTFEGGGDGQALALRLEAEIVAKADLAGERRMRQEATVATLIRPTDAVAETHKAELVELIQALPGGAASEVLGRHSVVTLAYGDEPRIREETKLTRLKADGSSSTWTVTAAAAPIATGRLSLDIEVKAANAARRLTYLCGAVAP